MVFSVQSELPPSHQLLLEHLERAFSKENSPPSRSSPAEAVPGKSAALCLWSSRCPVTGKTERKVIPGTGKAGAEPSTQTTASDRKRWALGQWVIVLEQQHGQGCPDLLPAHPKHSKPTIPALALASHWESPPQRITDHKESRAGCSLPSQGLRVTEWLGLEETLNFTYFQFHQAPSNLAQQDFIPDFFGALQHKNSHFTWKLWGPYYKITCTTKEEPSLCA